MIDWSDTETYPLMADLMTCSLAQKIDQHCPRFHSALHCSGQPPWASPLWWKPPPSSPLMLKLFLTGTRWARPPSSSWGSSWPGTWGKWPRVLIIREWRWKLPDLVCSKELVTDTIQYLKTEQGILGTSWPWHWPMTIAKYDVKCDVKPIGRPCFVVAEEQPRSHVASPPPPLVWTGGMPCPGL